MTEDSASSPHTRSEAARGRARVRRRLTVGALLAATLVVQPDWAPGQTAAGHGESIGVVVVEVPVRVLRRGNPVTDLTIDDFEILDRGVPQQITSFERVDAYAPAEEGVVEGGVSAEPAALSTPRGRHILLLFDFGLGGLPNRNHMVRSVRAARTMVREQLGPHDRVAVAMTSTLLWGFSGDPDVIGRQLDYVQAVLDADRKAARAAQEALQGTADPSSSSPYDADYLFRLATLAGRTPQLGFTRESDLTQQVAQAGGGPGAGLALDEPNPMVDPSRAALTAELSAEILEALGSLHQDTRAKARMIDTLRGVPAPKYVLMFSAGLNTSVLRQNRYVMADTVAALDIAVKGFVDAGWTIDSIDTQGIPVSGHSTDEVTIGGMPDSSVFGGAWGRRMEAFNEDALLYLSQETGGELQENANQPEDATRQILRRNAVTYLLAFHPSSLDGDGAYHRVEVRLKDRRRGGEIRHRPGYFEPAGSTLASPAEATLRDAELIMAGEGRTEIDGGAVAVPSLIEPGAVPYFLELDGRQLLALAGKVDLDLQIYAVHGDGSFRDAAFRTFSVDTSKAGDLLRRSSLRFSGRLEVEPGDYDLRTLVREKTSGAVSVFSSAFGVPAGNVTSPQLYLSILPQREQIHVLQEGLDGLKQGFDDFHTAQGTFLPSALPRLATDELLVAVLLATTPLDETPVARLSNIAGEVVGDLELVPAPAEAATPQLRRWGVVIAGTELQPGSYRLTIEIGDRSALERAFSRVR